MTLDSRIQTTVNASWRNVDEQRYILWKEVQKHYLCYPNNQHLSFIGICVTHIVEFSLSAASTSLSAPTVSMESAWFLSGVPGPQKILKALTGGLGVSSWRMGMGNQATDVVTHGNCPSTDVSCQTRYNGQNTCCFNYPGGQMLQTQFWDADPAVGPDDSWTIHGLW